MSFSPSVQQTIEMCRYCFMCRHANSTFLVTKLDSHTPRGYALILSEIDSGVSTWSEEFAEKLYQSTLDGVCRELCAFHWAEDEVVRAGREQAVVHGVVPAPVRAAVDALLAAPEVALPPDERERIAAHVDRIGADTLLLTGAVARTAAPDLIFSLAAVLDRCGEDWAVLGREPDTGLGLWELGLSSEGRTAAERLASAISALRPRRVVTGDAHALRALRDLYPTWGVRDLAGIEVLHATEYLAARLADGTFELAARADAGPVAYHDPCQLGRRLRVFESPRAIIRAATGREAVEFPHGGAIAECCGGGSLLGRTYPQLSAAMGRTRLEALAETGVDTVVTACPTCRSTLRAGAAEARSGVDVIDVIELAVPAGPGVAGVVGDHTGAQEDHP